FPTDLYAAAGVARLGDAEVQVVDRAELESAIDERVAVLCLTHVDFRTGELHDLDGLTRRAHEAGALALWDLCHSAGALEIDCEASGVDLAVGCGYKYLNGGPGAPSFMYVRRALQGELENPLPGWLGHETPFEFSSEWRAASGIRRFLTSSPSILAICSLEAALETFDSVDMKAVRRKSEALGDIFIEAVSERLPGVFELASPRDAASRGSQVSLRHRDAESIVSELAAHGVLGDFREPDLCRFGLAPLYIRYLDVLRAAETIAGLMGKRL
ncbi:MAG: aminotransferase class V-fold PLP-dependent enzyme, partial [Acidimicrobiales bacterium]